MLTRRRNNIVADDANERSRRSITAANRVDEDRRVEILKQRKKREPESAAIHDMNSVGDLEVACQPVDHDDAQAVIAHQHVSQPEDEELIHWRRELPCDRRSYSR